MGLSVSRRPPAPCRHCAVRSIGFFMFIARLLSMFCVSSFCVFSVLVF